MISSRVSSGTMASASALIRPGMTRSGLPFSAMYSCSRVTPRVASDWLSSTVSSTGWPFTPPASFRLSTAPWAPSCCAAAFTLRNPV